MGRRLALGLTVATLLAGACSSTVQEKSVTALRTGQDQIAASGDTTPTDAVTGGAVDDSSAGASGTGAAAGAKTSAGGAKATRPAAAGSSAPVKVGVNYSLQLGSIMSAIGGVDSTDGEAIDSIRPVVDYINAHGGIAGRKLEPVLHGVDPTVGTFATQTQQACTAFTDDNKVDAVITGAAAMGYDFTTCIARRGIPVFLELQLPVDDTAFRQHNGLLYQPFGISAERQGFWMDELAANGYFAGKLGILSVDDPFYKRYLAETVKPGLAKHGVSITSEFDFTIPGSAADASSFFSQASNAVLKFKAAGVDHVLFVPTGGSIPYAFMPSAESQSYRPRYAMNSYEITAFVDLQVNNKQLKDSLSVGWIPTSDVLDPQRPKDNPAERLCYTITHSRSDIPSRYCEGLFFLKAAWDASRDVSAAGLRKGAQMLGDSWRSPWTFFTSFGSGRTDGASQYRLVKFDDGCQCYVYAGPYKKVS